MVKHSPFVSKGNQTTMTIANKTFEGCIVTHLASE